MSVTRVIGRPNPASCMHGADMIVNCGVQDALLMPFRPCLSYALKVHRYLLSVRNDVEAGLSGLSSSSTAMIITMSMCLCESRKGLQPPY